MTRGLVVCHTGLQDSPDIPAEEFDTIEHLYLDGPQRNVQLRLENIEARIVSSLDPHALDLLVLAAVLYVGDTSISRGATDVYGTKWYRDLTFWVPVSEPDHWQQYSGDLEELLTQLSGDGRIRLKFLPRAKPLTAASYLEFPPTDIGFQGAGTIVLFSGGLDSLAGAVRELSSGSTPLLVSHRSVPIRATAQQLLNKELCNHFQTTIPAISVWVTRTQSPPRDTTQRMRAFLYLSLAAVVAAELKINRILYCENGITTCNLPISGQRIGTRSTRTTHPAVLSKFQEVVRKLLKSDTEVKNPLLFLTKAEVLEILKRPQSADLISSAISCGRSIGIERARPHCGTCYQCIVRRFAVLRSGTQQHDPIEGYEKDVFLDPLAEGEERANAMDWFRFNQKIDRMNGEQFFQEFPEAVDVVSYIPGELAANAEQIFNLHKRNASDVMETIKRLHGEYFKKLVGGTLPHNCMLNMIGKLEHLVDPLDDYVRRVAGVIERGLGFAFAKREPKDEKDLQQEVKAALAAAEERLRRESPTFTYSAARTTPDFSDQKFSLFIETKLLTPKRRLSEIVDEINADIPKYKTVANRILFVVYQTSKIIIDRDEFSAPFIEQAGIAVKVIG